MLISDIYVFDGLELNLECGYKCLVTVCNSFIDVSFYRKGHIETLHGTEASDVLVEIGNAIESGKDIRDAFNDWFINYVS